jgi:hypothetical protein
MIVDYEGQCIKTFCIFDAGRHSLFEKTFIADQSNDDLYGNRTARPLP